MAGPTRIHRLLSAARLAITVAVVGWLGGCAGGVAPPQDPTRTSGESPASQLVKAVVAESEDPGPVALYLDVVDRTVAAPDDPQATAALVAALHALVERGVEEIGPGVAHAAAFRSRSGLVETALRLRTAWAAAIDGAARLRPLVASSLHQLALRVGDVDAAILWRQRSACVPSATVFAPVAWPPLVGLDGPSPVTAVGPLPATVPGVAPFARSISPQTVTADACELPLDAASSLRGVRVVVADLHNPRAQRINIAMTSRSAAVVEVGGQRVLERPFSTGASPATMVARVQLEAGRARLVARVAQSSDGQWISLAAWDDAGQGLDVVAPVAGDGADARAVEATAFDGWLGAATTTPPERAEEVALAAAALLAYGRGREAAALLSLERRRAAQTPGRQAPDGSKAARALALLGLRATPYEHDLPSSEALTATQAAADRALESCPRCWEARIAKAAVLGQRAGQAKGTFAVLEAMGVGSSQPRKPDELTVPELAFVALTASRADLPDIERDAYDAVAIRSAGSALLADLDARLFARHGPALVRAACEAGTARSGSQCLLAHVARGDYPNVYRELRRLRSLRGSPQVHQAVELGALLAQGRLEETLAVLGRMPPSARSLAVLGAVVDWPGGAERLLRSAREALERDRLSARDTPYGLEPLARLLGATPDETAELEREGVELCATDRAHAYLPGAGTAVLRHVERYDLEPSGLLHFQIYDLRRVSGTVDVAEGAASSSPSVEARSVFRTRRQRIHKRDGRVLDPDPNAQGAQQHTELSQLEAGDYVEVIAEGWALPEDSGQIVVDSPDLLPPRTSVRDAEITFARPSGLPVAVWTHPLLGTADTEQTDEASTNGRIRSRWQLRDQPPRRIEEGVAPLEARVGLSFGTDDWSRIARALGERLRRLDEREPYVAQWVARVLGEEALEPRDRIARVVAATGRDVHEADPDALSDFVAALGSGPQRETARTMLEQGRGPRSWVIHRALREVGIASRIAVSETEPFSSSTGFPPRAGRFRHPLVVVDLPSGPLWIDADVSGPPLPPGQVSPELRGRQALLATGEIITVEGGMGFEPDAVDLRVRVDADGNATGTFTALLRGRAAQELGEELRVTVGSERDRLLRGVVLAWFPWADVREVTLSSGEASWQLSLRADVGFTGFARPEGRGGQRWSVPGIDAVHVIYPRAEATTLSARHAREAGRTSDLSIDSPLLFDLHRRVELPEGWRVAQLPTPLGIDHPTVAAARNTEQQGQVIEESFRLNLPAGTISAAEYDGFARELRRIDDGFAHGILVRSGRP